MTLVVNLTPAEEKRLRLAAKEKGVPPEELARQLIAELPGTESGATRRVSDELRAMAQEALQEHAAGLTEDFPA